MQRARQPRPGPTIERSVYIGRRMNPQEVRNRTFSRYGLLHRLFLESDVRQFLGWVADELAARDRHEKQLRHAITVLRVENEHIKHALSVWQHEQARTHNIDPR